MGFSQKTLKMLWGRAAGRCSMPDCRTALVMDATETDDQALVGENCHIVAEEDAGPRGDKLFPVSSRNVYGNLILLCANHHTQIDKQADYYTREFLHKTKLEHEEWVAGSLGLDKEKQADDEYYSGLIDNWEQKAELEYWDSWSSWLVSEQPKMSEERYDELVQLARWISSRVWPARYPQIEKAFENFRLVLRDFLRTFSSKSEARMDDKVLQTRRFYKIDVWDEEQHSYLVKKYTYHNTLLADLILELTRSANFICDQVRKSLTRSYRLKEGALTIGHDPLLEHSLDEIQPKYLQIEIGQFAHPYPGLEDFITVRGSRSFHYGNGPLIDSERTKT
ncbi:hypothetical protein GCM10010873_29510 [Cypionkella aquatica]|uniref:HNH nuclease domain-containing protein n=1 Tax=Cypionkella aquatica TaxID=1756042 RepID=A0AA37X1H4_9RHOB|nr:HNH endonuclease [Cypionkella aquatica]GLS87977.1 hypothetical protein GCM10010873_29510 [Cypionkella aquatica]